MIDFFKRNLLGILLQGTKGLTMFFLTLRDENNELNGIEIHKLKNKLGTRQLPTAELLLDGTKAFRVCILRSAQHSIVFLLMHFNSFQKPVVE